MSTITIGSLNFTLKEAILPEFIMFCAFLLIQLVFSVRALTSKSIKQERNLKPAIITAIVGMTATFLVCIAMSKVSVVRGSIDEQLAQSIIVMAVLAFACYTFIFMITCILRLIRIKWSKRKHFRRHR